MEDPHVRPDAGNLNGPGVKPALQPVLILPAAIIGRHVLRAQVQQTVPVQQGLGGHRPVPLRLGGPEHHVHQLSRHVLRGHGAGGVLIEIDVGLGERGRLRPLPLVVHCLSRHVVGKPVGPVQGVPLAVGQAVGVLVPQLLRQRPGVGCAGLGRRLALRGRG